MDPQTIQAIKDGGVVVLSLVILFGSFYSTRKGWIVTGSQYQLVFELNQKLETKLDAVTKKAEESADKRQEENSKQVAQLLETLASQRETIHVLVERGGANA